MNEKLFLAQAVEDLRSALNNTEPKKIICIIEPKQNRFNNSEIKKSILWIIRTENIKIDKKENVEAIKSLFTFSFFFT